MQMQAQRCILISKGKIMLANETLLNVKLN